ncbi:MAG TPA: molybdopterin-dependent oxidoreductase [Thermoanaerobaculia bacterium]|nr:molybdopterin-dependent oxidoreductase [Thermoanaerobaculia bacterium]
MVGRLDRRDFLRASGVAAGVALLEGCQRPHVGFIEQPIERNAPIPGVPSFRLGVCGQCPAGCGTRVRLADGEVKKIEGNPEHPVGRGGLCALGQSAPQGLYDPDRVTTPQRRVAGGGWETTSWEEALAAVAERIADGRARGAESIAILAPPDGVLEGLWRRVAAALDGALFVRSEAADAAVEREAARVVLGRAELPRYDLEGVDLVLTIGGDLIDRWRSPVHLARALQDARERNPRMRFVAALPRMSLTAARADRWLPVRPGTEGVLARALAGALLTSDRVSPEAAGRYRAIFTGDPPSLEEAATACDVAVASIRSVAETLRRARRPVVLGGGSAALGADGLAQVSSILALSLLVAGGERPTMSLPPAIERLTEGGVEPISIAELTRRLAAGQVELMLVADADPLQGASPRLRDAWSQAPHVVTLGSSWSDTALASELVLPAQVDLERLVATTPQAGPAGVAISLAQPVREPLGEARHPGDLALAIAATQDRLAVELPWSGFEELVQAVVAEDDRAAQRRAFDAGFWPESPGEAESAGAEEARMARPRSALARGGAVPSVAVLEDPASARPPSSEDAALRLIPFVSVKGDAEMANRPWLQELPDPMSTVMWSSWAELAPADADLLGVETGDRVRLSVEPAGAASSSIEAASIEAVAFVTPAARPGTVSVPLGGGGGRGRFARDRGADLHLLAAGEVEGVGVAALGDVVVTVARIPGASRSAVYGRGLRRPEEIPRGWRPHVPKSRGPGAGEQTGAAPEAAEGERG